MAVGVPRQVDARERQPVERGRRRDRRRPGVRARQPIFATVTQENTLPHLLGRGFGALTTIAQAAIPIGAVVTGIAVQQAGLIPTIAGMGAICVAVTVGMFFNPALRGMDIRDEPVSEPPQVRAAAQDAETMLPSRRTNIH